MQDPTRPDKPQTSHKHHRIILRAPAAACAVCTCHTACPCVVAIADRGRVFWSGPNLPLLTVKPLTKASAVTKGRQTIEVTDG